MKPIVVGGHEYTSAEIGSLREECIKWRNESFHQWPDAIPFTVDMTNLIAILAQVIEQCKEEEHDPR